MNYRIREVQDGDLPFLASNLRSADLRELVATYGTTDALSGLEQSVLGSDEALIGAGEDNQPLVVFGIRQVSPETSIVWATGTPEITKYRTPFARESRKTIARWFEQSPGVINLINFTHGSNTLHHRWLGWCGAQMLPEVPFGALGQSFRPFTIRRGTYDV